VWWVFSPSRPMTDFLRTSATHFARQKRTEGRPLASFSSPDRNRREPAVFSVVNALLLKPSYPGAGSVDRPRCRSPGTHIRQDWPSPGQLIAIKNENRSSLLPSRGRVGTLIGRGGQAAVRRANASKR